MPVLNTEEIQKLLPNSVLKNFKGFYMADEHPKREPGYYIYNLDDSKGTFSDDPNAIGNHFVGLVVTPNESFYFDPYARPPDDRLVKWLKKRQPKYPIYYSTIQIQDINSVNCGFFVIDFLTDMARGMKFYDAIHKYDINSTANNEKKIKYKYKI